MATEYLSMTEARELLRPDLFLDFCHRLEKFALLRDVGLSVQNAAAAVEVSPAMGDRFETTLSTLLAALKTQAAPEAPGAATNTHTTTRESEES